MTKNLINIIHCQKSIFQIDEPINPLMNLENGFITTNSTYENFIVSLKRYKELVVRSVFFLLFMFRANWFIDLEMDLVLILLFG